jgi:hypothetical protein
VIDMSQGGIPQMAISISQSPGKAGGGPDDDVEEVTAAELDPANCSSSAVFASVLRQRAKDASFKPKKAKAVKTIELPPAAQPAPAPLDTAALPTHSTHSLSQSTAAAAPSTLTLVVAAELPTAALSSPTAASASPSSSSSAPLMTTYPPNDATRSQPSSSTLHVPAKVAAAVVSEAAARTPLQSNESVPLSQRQLVQSSGAAKSNTSVQQRQQLVLASSDDGGSSDAADSAMTVVEHPSDLQATSDGKKMRLLPDDVIRREVPPMVVPAAREFLNPNSWRPTWLFTRGDYLKSMNEPFEKLVSSGLRE